MRTGLRTCRQRVLRLHAQHLRSTAGNAPASRATGARRAPRLSRRYTALLWRQSRRSLPRASRLFTAPSLGAGGCWLPLRAASRSLTEQALPSMPVASPVWLARNALRALLNSYSFFTSLPAHASAAVFYPAYEHTLISLPLIPTYNSPIALLFASPARHFRWQQDNKGGRGFSRCIMH